MIDAIPDMEFLWGSLANHKRFIREHVLWHVVVGFRYPASEVLHSSSYRWYGILISVAAQFSVLKKSQSRV